MSVEKERSDGEGGEKLSLRWTVILTVAAVASAVTGVAAAGAVGTGAAVATGVGTAIATIGLLHTIVR